MPDITISVSTEKYLKFKTGFLKIHPVPLDEETGLPIMAEGAWIRAELIAWAQHEYMRGHNVLQREAQETAELGIVT